MTLKKQILELRSQGKTYSQIQNTLRCSKGTIAYHCGKGQKDKYLKRQKQRRNKQHPYQKKMEDFKYTKYTNCQSKPKTATTNHILFLKLHTFFRTSNKESKYMSRDFTFTVQDIINKFGENPTCYLTGKQIDINKPRTYSFDHIIPRSRGGENTLDNLGICTKQANTSKTDMTPDEYINLCKQVLEHSGYTVTKT